MKLFFYAVRKFYVALIEKYYSKVSISGFLDERSRSPLALENSLIFCKHNF